MAAVLMILSALGRGVMYSFISDQFAPTKTERRRQLRRQQLQCRGRADTALLPLAAGVELALSQEVTRDYGLEFSGLSWNVVYGTQILALFFYSLLQAIERVLVIAFYEEPVGPTDGRVSVNQLKFEISAIDTLGKMQGSRAEQRGVMSGELELRSASSLSLYGDVAGDDVYTATVAGHGDPLAPGAQIITSVQNKTMGNGSTYNVTHRVGHLLSLGLQDTSSYDGIAMASIVILTSVGGLTAFFLGRKFYRHYVPSVAAMRAVLGKWWADLLGLPWSRSSLSLSSLKRNLCGCCGSRSGAENRKARAERRRDQRKNKGEEEIMAEEKVTRKKKKRKMSGKALDPADREDSASVRRANRMRNRSLSMGVRRRANTTAAATATLPSSLNSSSVDEVRTSPESLSPAAEGREREVELTTLSGSNDGDNVGTDINASGTANHLDVEQDRRVEENTHDHSTGAYLLSSLPGPIAKAAALAAASKRYLDQSNARIAFFVCILAMFHWTAAYCLFDLSAMQAKPQYMMCSLIAFHASDGVCPANSWAYWIVPDKAFALVGMVSSIFSIPIGHFFVFPALRRCLGRPVTGLENLAMSQVFCALAGAYAVWLEHYSKTVAPSIQDVFGDLGRYTDTSVHFTVWPLVLQFPVSFLYGVTEYLFSIGVLEYFFTNFPPAVKAMTVSTIFLVRPSPFLSLFPLSSLTPPSLDHTDSGRRTTTLLRRGLPGEEGRGERERE